MGATFIYFFLAWGGIILVLFLMSRELSGEPDKNEDEPR